MGLIRPQATVNKPCGLFCVWGESSSQSGRIRLNLPKMADFGQPFLGNRSAAVTPVTVGGKVFTFFVLIVGLGGVAVPTGLSASALSKARERE